MPTFEFEAMDATGQEIRDVIDAATEEEAQTTIRGMGYFVTRITVKRAAAGETVLDPSVVKPAPLAGERSRRLTPRETEVLQLICNGLSNRAIAAKLDLSVNTVAVHRANIMNALGVHKTAELVVYALQNGLVNPL